MGKVKNPNSLPFLQAQILQTIYLNIYEGKETTIEELAEITDYPADGKILLGAIQALVDKEFVIKDSEDLDFKVPKFRMPLYNTIIEKNDYKNKKFTDRLLTDLDNSVYLPNLLDGKTVISSLNKQGTIHEWYNYLEEFPYTLIEDKIIEYNLQPHDIVLDPFCGSGTTLVSANLFKMDAIGFDSNPLMKFVTEVKTTWDINLTELKKHIQDVAHSFLSNVKQLDQIKFKNDFISRMPKREINQWLSPTLQKEVSLLKDIIEEIDDEKIRNLLLLAMSKACFDASHVALCPGTTFYPFREKEEFWTLFTNKVIQQFNDLKQIQQFGEYGHSTVIEDTCLNAGKYIEDESVSFIITSPPYPNDLEYTRQTRLELYLLDFVDNMKDVQRIKRKMVKSSTKLIYKDSDSENHIKNFQEVMDISDKIYEQTKDKNWGFDYPRMVREYFGDMYLCLKEMLPLMKSNSHFLLVVGDQTIQGVFIPVGDIIISMAKKLGYINCRKEIFRVRRSTAHDIPLNEEIIILDKGE